MGLVADPKGQVAVLEGILPPEAIKLVSRWLQDLVQGPPARFGVGLVVSVSIAFWSSCSATGMLMTAVNICYGADEQRSFVRFNAQDVVLSVGLALFGVVAVALVAVLPAALALLPVPSTFHHVIALARWPFLAVLAMLALAIIYRYAPDRPQPRWQLISWGAAVATALWIIGSIAVTTYVSKVGSYDKTYGSLGAVIMLLLWFYLTT